MDDSVQVSLQLHASVSPTESRERVLRAAMNVLGDCDYTVAEGDGVSISSTSKRCLQKVHDQLRDRRVRGAARRILLRTKEGNRMMLLLNRQAAYCGIIAVCSSDSESPLGPLVLEVEAGDADGLLDWLTATA